MGKQDVHFSSDKMDYGTPQWFFDFWNDRYAYNVDVCADENNYKMKPYWSEKDDSLSIPWEGKKCWMNPPYGRGIVDWMKKAYEEAKEGAFVTCLIPSRTDTEWWHKYVMEGGQVFFIKGRIRFDGAPTGAPFPSAVVNLHLPQWSSLPIVEAISLKDIKNHKENKRRAKAIEHGVFQ